MKIRVVLFALVCIMMTVMLSSCGLFGRGRASPHCPAFSQIQQPTHSSVVKL